jgi:hypothetical protein
MHTPLADRDLEAIVSHPYVLRHKGDDCAGLGPSGRRTR